MAHGGKVTVDTLKRILEAFNRHNLNAIMAFFADDCVLRARSQYDHHRRRRSRRDIARSRRGKECDDFGDFLGVRGAFEQCGGSQRFDALWCCGTYQGTFFLPMTGRWQMAIHAGGSTARVPIQTEETVFVQPMSPWRVTLPGVAVVLVGLGFVVAGLRRMGAGVRGSWPELGAGAAFVIIGVVLAIRAVS